MKTIRLTCVFLLFIGTQVFAAHPLSTDDAGTVEINKYELEVGFDNCKDCNHLRSCLCGFSIKHGISKKADIGISFPYIIDPTPRERFGSASLGIKFLLIENTFALSLSNDLGAPGYFINGIYSVELSKLQIHANLGYTSSGDEKVKGEASYSSALVYPLDKYDIAVEVTGLETGLDAWMACAIYGITDTVSVDIGYGNGFKETNEIITAGIVLGF